MQLSRTVRRAYLVGLTALSILIIPTALLYASGYRLSDSFSLVETGGLYVSVPESGATVSINGETKGVTSLFTRSFYFDDLDAGSYVVQVVREGDHPWYRTLVVEPRIVTDTRALLVPQSLSAVELVRGGTSAAEDAISIPAAQYDAYTAAFIATSTAPVASTTTEEPPVDSEGGFTLTIEGGRLFVLWTRDIAGIPSALCVRPSSCRESIAISQPNERVTDARFFAGGVVYETKERGIVFAEIDARPTPLQIPLYGRKGAAFRIIEGALIVRDGARLYQIRGW